MMNYQDAAESTTRPTADGATAKPVPVAAMVPVSGLEGLSVEEANHILQRRTRALAQRPPTEQEGESLQVLPLQLGNETYAIDATLVERIDLLPEITPVPCTPDFVAGVINLRGRVLAILDLHKFLGLEGVVIQKGTQVITVRAAGMEVGLLADSTEGVCTLSLAELDTALFATTRAGAEYIRGATADMLVLLNLEALLANDKILVCEEVG